MRGQPWPSDLLTTGASTRGGTQGPQPGGEARAEVPKAGRGRLINLVAPQRAGNGTSDTREGGCILLIAQRCAGRRNGGGAQGRCMLLIAQQRAGRRYGGGAQESRRAGGLHGGGEFP